MPKAFILCRVVSQRRNLRNDKVRWEFQEDDSGGHVEDGLAIREGCSLLHTPASDRAKAGRGGCQPHSDRPTGPQRDVNNQGTQLSSFCPLLIVTVGHSKSCSKEGSLASPREASGGRVGCPPAAVGGGQGNLLLLTSGCHLFPTWGSVRFHLERGEILSRAECLQASQLLSLFSFSGLHPWYMEVLRLGVELALQLPAYATAIAYGIAGSLIH